LLELLGFGGSRCGWAGGRDSVASRSVLRQTAQ
jgi:hypothetical protein